MIFADKPKKIRVMFTPFRDGLHSTFGGKVRLEDVLPAMEASAELGIRPTALSTMSLSSTYSLPPGAHPRT